MNGDELDATDSCPCCSPQCPVRARQVRDEWRVWFKGSDMPTGAVDESTARRYLGLTADRLERRTVGQWETVE